MTYEEAIEQMDMAIEISSGETAVAFLMARQALEKQISKKPDIREIKRSEYSTMIDGRCPNCFARQSVADRSWHKVFNKFCLKCGQALDWSEK